MRLGISLEADPRLDTARTAERLGFDTAVMSSHVLVDPTGSSIDPLILLGSVAAATTRIKLAASVLVAPYYNPVVLANQALSLDVVSGGRFTLGVGVGYSAQEYAAVGVPMRERGQRLDEMLTVAKALWTGEPVTFDGRFTTLRGDRLGLRPVTPGGPPVWVGGHSEAALRRAMRFGDGWHGVGLTVPVVRAVRRQLEAIGEDVGRDPATVELTSVQFFVPPGHTAVHPLLGRLMDPARVVDDLNALHDEGVTMCVLWMPLAPEAMADAFEWVAAEVLPNLKG